MHSRFLILILTYSFIFSITLSNSVFSYCPPFRSIVDSIEPEADCLINFEVPFCGGGLLIKNGCEDFYQYSPNGTLIKILKDQEITINEGRIDWKIYNVSQLKNGDIVKYWSFKGKLGDQNLTIKGRTIYIEEQDNNISYLLFVVVITVLIIVSGILWMKHDKKCPYSNHNNYAYILVNICTSL